MAIRVRHVESKQAICNSKGARLEWRLDARAAAHAWHILLEELWIDYTLCVDKVKRTDRKSHVAMQQRASDTIHEGDDRNFGVVRGIQVGKASLKSACRLLPEAALHLWGTGT